MSSKGQRYRVRIALPVTVLTQWQAPYTGGRSAVVPAGETIELLYDVAGNVGVVHCASTDPRRMERELVHWSDRWRFWDYGGYSLAVQVAHLESHCERLDP